MIAHEHNSILSFPQQGRSIAECPARVGVDLHALGQLRLMDDGQWQSDGPVRGGVTDPDLLNDPESGRSPDENQNRLVEEAEEVEQGPRGGQKLHPHDNTNNNGDDEDYDSSKLDDEEEEEEDNEDEEEDMDSISGVYSPEPDGHIRDSPTPSPSPTGNREHHVSFKNTDTPQRVYNRGVTTQSARRVHNTIVS